MNGQMARVAVSAGEWRQFRQAALAQGTAVSRYLGRLVREELRRRGGTRVASITDDTSEVDRALLALSDVRRSIDELDRIAGRLARSTMKAGGSWADVGSSLGIRPEAARAAYERAAK